MNPLDIATDKLVGFDDDEESWRDKDYGVIYCMECGQKSEVVKESRLLQTVKCSDCGIGPETTFKPPFDTLLTVGTGILAGVICLQLGVGMEGAVFAGGLQIVLLAFYQNKILEVLS